jgi:hypothetical protein
MEVREVILVRVQIWFIDRAVPPPLKGRGTSPIPFLSFASRDLLAESIMYCDFFLERGGGLSELSLQKGVYLLAKQERGMVQRWNVPL